MKFLEMDKMGIESNYSPPDFDIYLDPTKIGTCSHCKEITHYWHKEYKLPICSDTCLLETETEYMNTCSPAELKVDGAD